MLSGEFSSIEISDIVIERGERIRKIITPERIAALAESFSRIGQIHPIVITRESVLVAGETRLEAARSLGWTHIAYQFSDTLDPKELLSIELEENVKRSDLTWQEECEALSRFHDLQVELHEGWSAEKTAEAIGIAPANVSRKLSVARAIRDGDERVLASKEYSTALGITQRRADRKVADAKALILEIEDAPTPVSPILHGDFCEWAPRYSGTPFNFIHCDFPYGIGADKFNQGAAKSFGGYEDSEDTYWKLVTTLVTHRAKLLGESGHIIFWFSMRHYAETLRRLKEVFWVDPYPLVWHKSNNKGTLPDPQRGPRRIYEVAFLCSHGDRKIVQSTSNVFSGPTSNEADHMSEKSEDMLRHFFKMVVDDSTRMLDPTCGGGSAIRAASALGASSVCGLELNPEFAANARRAWDARV